jgi:hypothetical protein
MATTPAGRQDSEPFSPHAKLPITLCLPNPIDGGTTGGAVHAEGIW